MNLAMQVTLVRLLAGKYSVEPGTIGIVKPTDSGVSLFVSWASGGSSGPIAPEHVEEIGEVYVDIPKDLERAYDAAREFVPLVQGEAVNYSEGRDMLYADRSDGFLPAWRSLRDAVMQ